MAEPAQHSRLSLALVALLFLQALPAWTAGPDGVLNTEIQCLRPPYDAPQNEAQRQVRRVLDVAQEQMQEFPTIAAALATRRPLICIDDHLTTARGYLEVDSNLIGLSQSLRFDESLVILFHELRHLEQLDRGFCASSAVSMAENARAIMATEADAMAITTLIAFYMRQEGNLGPWRAMLSWPNYADIAVRFAEVMEQTGKLSAATTAAFNQWYASDWRADTYYLTSCSNYLDNLESTKVLPSYALLPDDFLIRLCRLPSGEAYECEAK